MGPGFRPIKKGGSKMILKKYIKKGEELPPPLPIIAKLYFIGRPRYEPPVLFGECGPSGLGVQLMGTAIKETRNEKYLYYGNVQIDTQLWGVAPTLEDVIAALYWGEDNLGEPLEALGKEEFESWTSKWRIDCQTRPSGAKEWSIYVNDRPQINAIYGLKGRRIAHLHISCAGKLNEGIGRLTPACWYVFLKSIPTRSWEEIEAAHKDFPPKGIPMREFKWESPGKIDAQ
jgi:hypothetical protein